MQSVPIYQAKNQLSELIVAVEGGEEIVLTRRGVPVARLTALVGQEGASGRRIEAALGRLRALRESVSLDADLKSVAREGLD
ncbi:type II toxin-antitoxin system Phd/YefM family antitoxin [Pseudazoarcus pumilus]|uniref:Antitoxin n=1 Tax=Pseudazoarcus pumilus TaxID=2067960 RepID=A0A2I6S997_9RHOO|nr:type II toxin-antitoxin system prevent-host-death family antitoxin [Pseudazoarcus pumilus]AUN95828.1 type II toxin-antitoxin system prevent-host-death family antitoxin [Pseudazoarcus pumilus]